MNFRSTLVLALLVAALGAWIWRVERPKVEQESAKRTLLAFPRDRVTGIELAYPDVSITLRRNDGTWQVMAPVEAPADAGTVRDLLAAIGEAESKKVVAEKADSPALYGLDAPTATVTLVLDDGTRLPSLRVGRTTPVGHSAYAQVGDNPSVLLTTAAFHAGVRKSVADLRDKTILAFHSDALREVRILANGRSEVVLAREGDAWRLARPFATPADASQVQGFLSTLESLRADGFVDGVPTSEQGLLPPERTVTLVPREGVPLELLVGRTSGEGGEKKVFVARGARGPVYSVSETLAVNLTKEAGDFRDKTIVTIARESVASVVVTRADGEGFTLEKKGEHWTLAGPATPAETARQALLDRFAEDARTLRGSEVAAEPADAHALGLDHPAVAIALRGTDGATLATIRIAERDGAGHKETLAGVEGGSVAWTLAEHVFQRIDRKRADFIDTATPAPAA